MATLDKKTQDKILADAILLLQNNPEYLKYLLALPRRYSYEKLLEKMSHSCPSIRVKRFMLSKEDVFAIDDVLDDLGDEEMTKTLEEEMSKYDFPDVELQEDTEEQKPYDAI